MEKLLQNVQSSIDLRKQNPAYFPDGKNRAEAYANLKRDVKELWNHIKKEVKKEELPDDHEFKVARESVNVIASAIIFAMTWTENKE